MTRWQIVLVILKPSLKCASWQHQTALMSFSKLPNVVVGATIDVCLCLYGNGLVGGKAHVGFNLSVVGCCVEGDR